MDVIAYTNTDSDIVRIVLKQDDEEVAVEMTKDEFVKYISEQRHDD